MMANQTPNQSTSKQALYNKLVAGLKDFIFGRGQADIMRQLQQANENTIAVVIGHITYALVQQASDQAEQAGVQAPMDVLMGVATQVIESLEKMAASMNIPIDPEAVSFRALIQAMSDNAQSNPDQADSQQQAQQALRSVPQDQINQTASFMQQMGARHGVDTFGKARQRQAMSQGLMGVRNA